MFEQFIGNEQAKRVLTALLAADRLPQSLLFAGNAGLGKRSFAMEAAKFFLCTDRGGKVPCGVCSACMRSEDITSPRADKKEDFEQIVFSGHPDFGIVLPYRKTILIEAVRDLEREANFRPFESAKRFFIIKDAEKLSAVKQNAANALLKTLEEPQPSTYLILLSSRPLLLLPTIRSRCQTIRFRPIPKKEIAEYLTRHGGFSTGDAKLAAGLCGGSVGRALSTDLDAYRETRRQMIEVVRMSAGRQHLAGLVRAAETISGADSPVEYEFALNTLEKLVHDIWRLKLANPESVVNFDIVESIEQLAGLADTATFARWLDLIEDYRADLGYNLNRRIGTAGLFAGMAS